MDQKTMVKQVFDFQKNTFDNVYKSMVTIQDQAEKSVSFFLDRAPWIPEESKQIIIEWGNMYKKGRDDLKKAVDNGYEKMETYVASTAEATQSAAQQTTQRAAQQSSKAATEARKAAGRGAAE
jgi:hypothetical protein